MCGLKYAIHNILPVKKKKAGGTCQYFFVFLFHFAHECLPLWLEAGSI